MFKVQGHFDTLTDMFVLRCTPVLSNTSKDLVICTDPMCFSTSHTLDLSIIDFPQNASELLGYSTQETNNMKLYNIISPECLAQISQNHSICN
jgi:hypothetical protein